MSDPAQAVFLSYASEDTEAARRICAALREAGVEVWFDQSELVGGDQWDATIRRQIAACALFVPVISAHTQARLEGYFRLEWKLAAQRTHTMAEEKTFLLPVVIDGTRDAEAKVPAEFKAVQWTRAPEGEAAAGLVTRVKQLVGGIEVGRVSNPPRPATSPSMAGQSPALPPNRRAPNSRWILATLGVSALGLLAFIALRPTPKDAPAPAPTTPVAEAKSTAAANPSIVEKSISVLPFENRSAEPDSAYFANGIQDEIIAGLSLLADLRVIGSSTSVEVFRASKKPLPQIARELGVAWVLRGSVDRAAGAVTVNVQLIRGEADQIVWANTFKSDLNGAAAIQAQVVTALTNTLKAGVSPAEKALLARTPTVNAEAFDLYLRQREILARVPDAPKVWKERRDLLEKAVVLDPGFVQAWAGLVRLRRASGTRPSPTQLAASKAALDTLEKLAPGAAETALERVAYLAGTVEPQQALAMYEDLARNWPQSVAAMNAIGWLQRELGRWADAIGSMRRAIALDPVDTGTRRDLIEILIHGRRLREALQEQRNLVALLPEERNESFLLGRLAYNIDGSTREMDRFFAQLPRNDLETREVVTLRMRWAQLRGDRATAVDLEPRGEDSVYHAIAAGATLASNGDRAAASARLAKRVAALRARSYLTEWGVSDLALMEAVSGSASAAMAQAAELERRIPDVYASYQPIFRARLVSIYAWAGAKERALNELDRLLREPGPHFVRFTDGDDRLTRINIYELRTSLEFSPLRGDPRFEALLNDPKNNAPLF